MSLLFYRRPDYVARAPGPMDPAAYERYLEKTRQSIPPQLSFEMVVSNRAMPPCSLQDFMGYLLYVSHDAENLQFYLWLQDYTKRFFEASHHEQALSPRWNVDDLPQQTAAYVDSGPRAFDKTMVRTTEYPIDFDNKDIPLSNMEDEASLMSASVGSKTIKSVKYANQQTGLKWQSFTIQPFRAEINRVISHYLAPGAVRELNLSHKNRSACLHALQHTTHPSAFSIPASIVSQALRNHSHPNFIRWSTVNGNSPRIIFGRVLGLVNILFGFLIAVLLMLSTDSRWWRIWALPVWFLGFSFLLAGSNGICLVLYVTKDRHLRPWEQFTNDSASTLGKRSVGGRSDDIDLESDQATLAGSEAFSISQTSSTRKSGGKKAKIAVEAFGTANAYGHEVWVEKYRAKMMIRKIFDSCVWVQNEHIRIVQDHVAYQALAWSVIISVPLCVLFTALPRVGVIH